MQIQQPVSLGLPGCGCQEVPRFACGFSQGPPLRPALPGDSMSRGDPASTDWEPDPSIIRQNRLNPVVLRNRFAAARRGRCLSSMFVVVGQQPFDRIGPVGDFQHAPSNFFGIDGGAGIVVDHHEVPFSLNFSQGQCAMLYF